MSKINLQHGKLTVENRKSREKKRICSEVSVLSDSPCVEYPVARTANTARGAKRGLLLQMSCRDVAWSVCACWWRGVVVSGIRRMNEVNPRRARLVPGWVTVFGRVYHLSM